MDILYIKTNRFRAPHYQTEVMIYDDIVLGEKKRYVSKRAVNKKAQTHLNNIAAYTLQIEHSKKSNEIKVLKPIEQYDDRLIYPFIRGESWNSMLIRIYRDDGIERLIEEIERCHALVNRVYGEKCAQFKSEEAFEKLFGTDLELQNEHCQKQANVDMIFSNFITTESGEHYQIDCEWVFPFAIPTSFNLFRSLNVFWNKYKNELVEVEFADFVNRFGISQVLLEKYARMEESFQNFVHHGDSTLNAYLKPRISANQLFKSWLNSSFYAKAFIPLNNAYYSVKDYLVTNMQAVQWAHFDFNEPFEDHIRIDLVPFPALYEIHSITIHTNEGELIYKCKSDLNNVTYCENTCVIQNGNRLILLSRTSETHIFIKYSQNGATLQRISISFELIHKISDELLQEMTNQRSKIEFLEMQNAQQNNQIATQSDQLSTQTSKIKSQSARIESLEGENADLRLTLERSNAENNKLTLEANQMRNKLNFITSSKVWRVYSKLRRFEE